jgi:hypothetical protein
VAGNVSSVGGTNNFNGAFTNGGAIAVSGGVSTFNTGTQIVAGGLTVSGGVLGVRAIPLLCADQST